MFLIAKEASLGILGFSLMIWSAKSLIESIVAENSLSLISGISSATASISDFI